MILEDEYDCNKYERILYVEYVYKGCVITTAEADAIGIPRMESEHPDYKGQFITRIRYEWFRNKTFRTGGRLMITISGLKVILTYEAK